MEKDSRKLELAVGAFLITGIAVVMIMVVYMTGGVSLSHNAFHVIVDIQNIGDLKAGAPVKLGGVQIGSVRKISIADENIQIVAGIDRRYRLRADTQAAIATSGLVGDSFLELSRGKSAQFLPNDTTEENATHIPGVTQAAMGELLSQVQMIGTQVQELVRNINKVVGKEDFRKNIEESVSNLNGATHEAKDLLAGLRKDLVKVDEAVANVVKITAAAEGTMGKINYFVEKTIGDPAKVESINQTIANISEVTGVLSQNRDYISTTIKNVSDATSGLARVTAGLDPSRGLFRLLTDEQAGQELLSTIQNLQRAANALATIGLTDLIADKLAADKMFELWQKENKFTDAAQMSAAWKEWMARQKRLNQLLINQTGGLPAPICAPSPLLQSYGR